METLKRGLIFFKTKQLSKNVFPRCYATKAEKKKGIDRKVGPKIDSAAASLAARGFLRAQKSYSPPEDLQSRLETIFKSTVGTIADKAELTNNNDRFNLFKACSEEFQHTIPNSQLHKMETLGDVKRFYNTPIDTRTPLDELRNVELPENLHIQFDYYRFRPDNTIFGKTAFNESNTIVTGLKYKGKYPGYIAKKKYPI